MRFINPFDAFIILLALTPLGMLALHAAAGRVLRLIAPDIQPQLTVIICAAIGLFPMAAGLWHFYLGGLAGMTVDLLFGAVFATIVYGALAYVYFHLFNMSETARRIKILSLLYRDGALDKGGLGSGYGAKEMLEARLERLISTGQIREFGGRYIQDGKVLYLAARVVSIWAWVLGMPFEAGGRGTEGMEKRD